MKQLHLKLIIYPEVDLQRAFTCLNMYLEIDKSRCTGRDSLCIFSYQEVLGIEKWLCIYRTKTAIVVRNG